MIYNTHSPEYDTVRQKWPLWLPKQCPNCQSKVQFKYADNGKLVYTLMGIIDQIITYYACNNDNCEYFSRSFTLVPRFDYGERRYGSDVFREIANDFLLYHVPIDSIYLRLKHKYNLEICQRTVSRICDDILNLKAYQIDQNTKAMLQKDSKIVLALDGQNPGKDGKTLWLFMDLLKNGVLYTCVVDSIDHAQLHQIIEEIKDEYQLQILGFVSDKQNTLVKCFATYYSGIPHQFCQYLFFRNTWNHLETLDSNLFLPLRKALNKIYIHSADKTIKINFNYLGFHSVHEIFKSVDTDFQKMCKVRNKTFQQLRGVWLYQSTLTYVQGMKDQVKQMDPDLRVTKIFTRTFSDIFKKLEQLTPLFNEILSIHPYFNEIKDVLNKTKLQGIEQQVLLDEI